MLKMMKGALLILSLVVIAGCASSGTDMQTTSGPPANAAGSWSGYAGVGAVSAPVTLRLTQNGGNVTGELAVAGTPEFTGPVNGTVQGNMLKLWMQSGRSLTPMTVDADKITGIVGAGPVTLRRAN